ncbi:NADH dehydrogenase beta subunit [Microseira wollei NIES-4236]|uniref:NADH dehydrogenase beta subunit n=1 Tax=Microseira wollei NIES-4236 TaxID=2530354 RepID=A0AAV3XLH3_9CYAN|nr:NADH dehydrogenase beta subunit [Microseira wollei NIES-4236]
MIAAGTITMKMAPALVRLYEQMPEPKYVIAMGACTITGGMFSVDSPTAVRGVDKLIPVDVYSQLQPYEVRLVCQARSINAARLTNEAKTLYLTRLQSAVYPFIKKIRNMRVSPV